uniref:Chalcone/stilbene synthase C-terminal domain-containing protein n=1 Tax=Oryza punctata TaxID=4537 RepID=A0A0E0M5V0_ORYPU
MQVTGSGIDFNLSIQVWSLIKDNIQQSLLESFQSIGNTDPDYWKNLFHLFQVVHPGGHAILDNIEGKLKLQPLKLAASHQVLRQFGNMSGATIAFVLDKLCHHPEKEEDESHKAEWGVMLVFGPGITIETIVLRNPLARGQAKLITTFQEKNANQII